ncbi:MAG: FUSC family protein [Chthoniobacteraceae bacterium]|jgi:uncharacterized membrane protein YccC
MDAATAISPASPSGGLDWLRRELAPYPGRGAMTLRIVAATVLVVIISMTLQIPEVLISAYMVIFATKENKVVTTLVGTLLIIAVTFAIAVTLLFYRFTFDFPELRIPAMALILFLGFFASRVLAIGPLGFGVGFVIAGTQSIAELMPSADYLVHWLLWLWVAVTYPIALTVVVNRLMSGPAMPKAPGPPKPKKRLLAPDAFTNPVHVHFALKVTLAAMTCYILYSAVDWPGIHTAFVTCCFISLESIGATLHKGALRLAGCACGGLLGFLSIMYLIPHMESIISLVFLVAAVSTLAGWVAAGSERIAYAGLQIALAFYMCVLQEFEPDTDFVGIVLGIVITTLAFRYLWPEPVDRTYAAQ